LEILKNVLQLVCSVRILKVLIEIVSSLLNGMFTNVAVMGEHTSFHYRERLQVK